MSISAAKAGVDVANTMTVYKFNAAGKLCHLDVYLQHKPAQAA